MPYSPEAEAIDALLIAAFGAVPKPPREALINLHCEECLETSEAFADKPWVEVTLDELLLGRETALLTAAAWRYYLPAVIRWTVREPVAVDVINDNLVYQLEPPDPEEFPAEQFPGQREYFAERSTGFDDRQRAAIVAFLDWYRAREEAEWRGSGWEPPHHAARALAFWSSAR